MKVVGDALKHISHVITTKSNYSQTKAVRCVGIVPWGVVPYRKRLIVKSREQKKSVNKLHIPCEGQPRSLDSNHSHFLLVDNGYEDGEYYGEDTFKRSLENYIIRKSGMSNLCILLNPVFSLVIYSS